MSMTTTVPAATGTATRLALDLRTRRDVFGDAATVTVPDEVVDVWDEYATFVRCGRPVRVRGGARWPAYPAPDRGPALWFSGGVESTYTREILAERGIEPTVLSIADHAVFDGPDRTIGQIHFMCAAVASAMGYGPIYLGMERNDLLLGRSEFMRGYLERHPCFADWWSRYQPQNRLVTVAGDLHKEEILEWLAERGIRITGTCDRLSGGRWCGECYKCFEAFYSAKAVGIDLGIRLSRAAFEQYHGEFRDFVDSGFSANFNNAYQHYVRLQISYGLVFDRDVDCSGVGA